MIKDRFAHITDQELLDRYYAEKNNDWLGALLQRYTLLLFGVCMKYLKNEEEARDSVQQVFLKAITEVEKYRVVYFKAWIYMVAKNYCLMKLRNGHGKISASYSGEVEVPAEEMPNPDSYQEKEQLFELMGESLAALNKEQKWCVTLFYLEKKSYSEISGLTGYSTLQVKSHLQNGKRNLKILLDKKLNKNV